jgi:hypothetical protein
MYKNKNIHEVPFRSNFKFLLLSSLLEPIKLSLVLYKDMYTKFFELGVHIMVIYSGNYYSAAVKGVSGETDLGSCMLFMSFFV